MASLIFRTTFVLGLVFSSTVYGLAFTGDNCNFVLNALRATPSLVRPLESVDKLKVVNYNLKDFKATEHSQFSSSSKERDIPIKNSELVEEQKKMIREWNADILTVEEVYDEESLKELCPEGYAPVFIEGNDISRHIGFLIKKDLPYFASIETHSKVKWQDTVDGKVKDIFSRDLPAIVLRADPSQDPLFIILGHHGKAMRSRRGDFESHDLRFAQSLAAAKIIEGYKRKYPNTGIVLAGDFNADMQVVDELDPLKTFLVDPFEIKHVPIPERATYTYFPPKGARERTQKDNIFVSPNLKANVVSVRVIPYYDDSGRRKPIPSNLEERGENPSDHQAVEVVIKTH